MHPITFFCVRSTHRLIRYFECLHILYRETFFDFSHSALSLALAPKRLPPTHLALISRANFTWTIFHPLDLKATKLSKDAVLWVGIWKALAVMEGLEWLRVEIDTNRPWNNQRWTELEWTLWDDVKQVTRPSHFELILPFSAAASTREETLPCTIIRRVEDTTQELS